MKIIIIGGGICGLSTYLALKKHLPSTTTIKLYESHPSPLSTTFTIGGGLGLAPNGQRALHALNPRIVETIAARGFGCDTIHFHNASGRKLGAMLAGSKARYGFEQQFLPRAEVHTAVLAEVGETEDVHWGRKVESVREEEDKVYVLFADGTTEEADLVLGCDGVRSVVRPTIVDNADAEYQGLTGTGGFLPVSSLPAKLQEGLKTESVCMTFGPDGFFGYSLCNKDRTQLQWWSTFESAAPLSRDVSISEIRDAAVRRHKNWVSPHDEPGHPVFENIIMTACGESTSATAAEQDVLVLPVYVIPRIPRWGSESGRILLLGDAAHAMPPDTGQGVSCAVEDVVAIAMLLEHAGDGIAAAGYKQLRREYEGLRMPRIHKILDLAKRMGDNKKKLGTVQELVRDVAMWVICKLPESLADDRFSYDVEKEVEKIFEKDKKRRN